MFSWFLKLLGINEDKPVSSGSNLLDANKKDEPEQSVKEVTIEAPLIPEPETVIKTEVKPEVEQTAEPGKESESEPEQVKSLIDEFPSLKANVIKVLSDAGFTSKELVEKASDKDLLALKGIGPASIKVLRS